MTKKKKSKAKLDPDDDPRGMCLGGNVMRPLAELEPDITPKLGVKLPPWHSPMVDGDPLIATFITDANPALVEGAPAAYQALHFVGAGDVGGRRVKLYMSLRYYGAARVTVNGGDDSATVVIGGGDRDWAAVAAYATAAIGWLAFTRLTAEKAPGNLRISVVDLNGESYADTGWQAINTHRVQSAFEETGRVCVKMLPMLHRCWRREHAYAGDIVNESEGGF